MTNSPISPEERNRFLQELIAHSPESGVTPAEQGAALREFIDMLCTYGIVDAWYRGRIEMGWGPSGLIWYLGLKSNIDPKEDTA